MVIGWDAGKKEKGRLQARQGGLFPFEREKGREIIISLHVGKGREGKREILSSTLKYTSRDCLALQAALARLIFKCLKWPN